jgi:hypothetical protein
MEFEDKSQQSCNCLYVNATQSVSRFALQIGLSLEISAETVRR